MTRRGFKGNVYRHDDPVEAFNTYVRPRARRIMRTWVRLGRLSFADYERITNPKTRQDVYAFSQRANGLACGARLFMWFWWRPLWWRRRKAGA